MTLPVLRGAGRWEDWSLVQIAAGNSCKAIAAYPKVQLTEYHYPLNGSVLLRCLPLA